MLYTYPRWESNFYHSMISPKTLVGLQVLCEQKVLSRNCATSLAEHAFVLL